jgi:predicted dehydrogenase
MKKFDIAIIGAGLIAETAHIPAILKCQNANLKVIIDKNLERAEFLRDKFNLDVKICNDIDDYHRYLDGAIICTPNNTHKMIAIKCLQKRMNILVEKPLANTLRDADEIVETGRINDCFIMVGFCTRYWSSILLVKEIIDGGALGNVKGFVFQYGSAGGWAPISNYITSKQEAGGGAFVINGSHYLDRMLWFFGMPTNYIFFDDSRTGLESNAIALFSYNKNTEIFAGEIRISKTVNLVAGCVIEFDNGILTHRDWASPSITLKLRGLDKESRFIIDGGHYMPEERRDMYLTQLEDFIYKSRKQKFENSELLKTSLMAIKITEELYLNKRPLPCEWYVDKISTL